MFSSERTRGGSPSRGTAEVDKDGYRQARSGRRHARRSYGTPRGGSSGHKFTSHKGRSKETPEERRARIERRNAYEKEDDQRKARARRSQILKDSNVVESREFVAAFVDKFNADVDECKSHEDYNTLVDEASKFLVSTCNAKKPVEVAKILDELLRYGVSDIVSHPSIMELIKATRAQDGHSFLHWTVFPSKNLTSFDLAGTIRTIQTLHDCGCSPFAVNSYGETCLDALKVSVKNANRGKAGIPQEHEINVYMALLNVPMDIKIQLLRKSLNKVTMETIDKFRSHICWAVDSDECMEVLAEIFVNMCLAVNSAQKSNGHYSSIDKLHEITMIILKGGPSPGDILSDYFKARPWDPLWATHAFFTKVISIATLTTPEDLNSERQTADALGAIIGEVGNTHNVEMCIEREFTEGRPMHAITCLAHGGILTESIVNSILTHAPKLSNMDRMYIELAIGRFMNRRFTIEQLEELEFDEDGYMIRTYEEPIFVASGAGAGYGTSADADGWVTCGSSSRASVVSDDMDSYVPPFNIDHKSFGFSGIRSISAKELSYNKETGEMKPEKADDVAYSLQKTLEKGFTQETITTLMAQIVEDLPTEALVVAKFILDNTKAVTSHAAQTAVKELMAIPSTQLSSCFDNPKTTANIMWLMEEYDCGAKAPTPKSSSKLTNKFGALDDSSDDEIDESDSDPDLESKGDEGDTVPTAEPVVVREDDAPKVSVQSKKKTRGKRGNRKGRGKGKKGRKSKSRG